MWGNIHGEKKNEEKEAHKENYMDPGPDSLQ